MKFGEWQLDFDLASSILLPFYFLYLTFSLISPSFLPHFFLFSSSFLSLFFLFSSSFLPLFFLFSSSFLPLFFFFFTPPTPKKCRFSDEFAWQKSARGHSLLKQRQKSDSLPNRTLTWLTHQLERNSSVRDAGHHHTCIVELNFHRGAATAQSRLEDPRTQPG